MLFLQLSNAAESTVCRFVATILPAILVIAAIVTFLADLTIAIVEAVESAANDCRILLGTPTPMGNAPMAETKVAIELSCRECIAMLKQMGISRRVDGKPANVQMMRQMIANAH